MTDVMRMDEMLDEALDAIAADIEAGVVLQEAAEEERYDRLLAEWIGLAPVGALHYMIRYRSDWYVWDLIAEHLGIGLGYGEQGPPPPPPEPPRRKEISSGLRKRIMERDAYRCRRCKSWTDLHIDHVLPVSAGGTNDPDNLQVLCAKCNLSKGAKVE